jgi:hypothetical protein
MLMATGASNPGIVARNDNLAIAVKITAKNSAKFPLNAAPAWRTVFLLFPPFFRDKS